MLNVIQVITYAKVSYLFVIGTLTCSKDDFQQVSQLEVCIFLLLDNYKFIHCNSPSGKKASWFLEFFTRNYYPGKLVTYPAMNAHC